MIQYNTDSEVIAIFRELRQLLSISAPQKKEYLKIKFYSLKDERFQDRGAGWLRLEPSQTATNVLRSLLRRLPLWGAESRGPPWSRVYTDEPGHSPSPPWHECLGRMETSTEAAE